MEQATFAAAGGGSLESQDHAGAGMPAPDQFSHSRIYTTFRAEYQGVGKRSGSRGRRSKAAGCGPQLQSRASSAHSHTGRLQFPRSNNWTDAVHNGNFVQIAKPQVRIGILTGPGPADERFAPSRAHLVSSANKLWLRRGRTLRIPVSNAPWGT